MSDTIYIKRFEGEGYALVTYTSSGWGRQKSTTIRKLTKPFPTFGQALAAKEERERENMLVRNYE